MWWVAEARRKGDAIYEAAAMELLYASESTAMKRGMHRVSSLPNTWARACWFAVYMYPTLPTFTYIHARMRNAAASSGSKRGTASLYER